MVFCCSQLNCQFNPKCSTSHLYYCNRASESNFRIKRSHCYDSPDYNVQICTITVYLFMNVGCLNHPVVKCPYESFYYHQLTS